MTNRPRRRKLRARPGELIAYYGYDGDDNGPDLSASYGPGVSKADGNLLLDALGAAVHGDLPLWQELEARGYDLDTLKFAVRKKTSPIPASGKGANDAAT